MENEYKKQMIEMRKTRPEITTMENVFISSQRQCGNTSRQIQMAIDHLYAGYRVKVISHESELVKTKLQKYKCDRRLFDKILTQLEKTGAHQNWNFSIFSSKTALTIEFDNIKINYEFEFERWVYNHKFDVKKRLSDIITPLEFHYKIGDVVWYTNEAGIKFGPYRVMGFIEQNNLPKDQCIYISKQSYWMPVVEESLTICKNVNQIPKDFLKELEYKSNQIEH